MKLKKTESIPTSDELEIDSKVLAKLTRRLKYNCTSINNILKEFKEICPTACLYLDGTHNLNLMTGPSHSGLQAKSRQDRIIASADLYSDGGDW